MFNLGLRWVQLLAGHTRITPTLLSVSPLENAGCTNVVKVKNVYYIGAANRIYERQAKANNSNAWANDNLSGLYTAAQSSSLNVYWTQNITNTSQALCVIFQDKTVGLSTFSIGKYTSYGSISNEWVLNTHNYTIKEGSPLAMVRLSRPDDVVIYAVGKDSRLDQYRYNISTDAVTEFGS